MTRHDVRPAGRLEVGDEQTADGGAGAGRTPAHAPVPATPAQERFWFLQQLDPGAPATATYVLGLDGDLDRSALERALTLIVQRHEPLRTVFAAPGGRLQAVALTAPPSFDLELVDAENAGQQELRRLVAAHALRPVDLEHGPLFRPLLVRTGDRAHVLVLDVHRAVFDHWSLLVVVGELTTFYAALVEGREPDCAPLAVDYESVAHEQHARLTGESFEADLAYWREQLADAPPALKLPAAVPVADRPAPEAARLERRLPADVGRSLNPFASVERATPFAVGLAALATVLSRFGGRSDVAVGTAVPARTRPHLADLVGCFLNLAVLRLDADPEGSFRALVRQARGVVLGALAHQEIQFDRVLRELASGRSGSENPFTSVGFDVLREEPTEWSLPGLRVRAVDLEPPALDGGEELALLLSEHGDQYDCIWTYDAARIPEALVGRLHDAFGAALAAGIADPDTRLSEISLLAPGERRRLLVEWNDTTEAFPDASIPALVGEQARRHPDAPAVVGAGETLSYRELERRAAAVAGWLRGRGVGAESVVAVCLPPGVERVVVLLGILKAGAAYTALDPRHPPGRLSFLVGDSGARLVVAVGEAAGALTASGVPVVAPPRTDTEVGDGDGVGAEVLPGGLAYVLYTSGSTGRPKGVGVTHRNVARLLKGAHAYVRLGPGERFLQLAPLVYDVSTIEIWGPLANGGATVAVDTGPGGERLGEVLRRYDVTTLNLVPPQLAALVDGDVEELAPVRQLIVGGEVVPSRLVASVRDRLPSCRVVPGYGPTEVTVIATAFTDDAPVRATMPIGRPVPNTQAYVLDEQLEPLPVGAPGEIHLGGPGVARGYLGRPSLTAERFLPDPHGVPGSRLYRTGDLGWLRDDGNIEFLGRSDQQVKIRGHRIELGEIEHALTGHPDVARAAVVARAMPAGPTLVGYVVPARGRPDLDDVRRHLSEQLPAYMIPSFLVPIAEIPLTANNKTDVAALPDPEPVEAPRPDDGPSTPLETELAQIWAELLSMQTVPRDVDFFDLGGHSLLALQATLRTRRRLGLELGVGVLLAERTLRRFAAAVERARAGAAGASSPLVSLREGSGPPVVLVHPGGGGIACYAELSALLEGQPVFAFEALRPPVTTLTALAAEYLEELRRHASPPWVLGGWSLGATLAFEMALDAVQEGVPPPPLVLLDPIPARPEGELTYTEGELLVGFLAELSALLGMPEPLELDPRTVPDEPAAALESAIAAVRAAGVDPRLDQGELLARYEIFRAHEIALIDHGTRLDVPELQLRYDGPVYLIEADETPTTLELWLPICTNLETLRLPGDHSGLARGGNASRVAAVVDRARRDAAGAAAV